MSHNHSMSAVLEAYRAGKPVVITDDEDRENEGDIAVATEKLTVEHMALMATQARGLICVSIAQETARRLSLPLQAENNASRFGTPFAVSVDHRSVAAHGGTFAARVATMRALVDPSTRAEDLVSPGSVFPLVANVAGVLGRQGQTEGAYDLARLAGLAPSGVICEILAPDGTMARGASLDDFVRKHGLLRTSVREIISYRMQNEVRVRLLEERSLSTAQGTLRALVFLDESDGKEHVAVIKGTLNGAQPTLVRIHSECLTGDVFGSERCDCGPQLAKALDLIHQAGSGVVLYLRQEGRGIGLVNKLKAYALQDGGLDTVEANAALGFPADARSFVVASRILTALGVSSLRLLTNNPAKVNALEKEGLRVIERLPLITSPSLHSERYLEAKRTRLGHLL